MFTGIIEAMGVVSAISKEGTNTTFTVKSPISKELKIDQSVSHNGVCLTVVAQNDASHTVTAIDETLQKTNLGALTLGSAVNLERCMPANGRFDGHIVQGHVDQTATCIKREDKNGSWLYRFAFYAQTGNIVVEKGSVCVNGISLTCFDVADDAFSVAIIPYTFEHTNLKEVEVNSTVNLEFDILGKYMQRLLKKQHIM
ncbi:MAG: riboflavin synthase [Cyclobacteriaceae bacterium]|jgi:riboflavin synthase|nr:riboflavin synthase [Cytophagales bacterium]MCZ8327866.1 riboflavin synthase [Cyclobacteriaceae bacterium]